MTQEAWEKMMMRVMKIQTMNSKMGLQLSTENRQSAFLKDVKLKKNCGERRKSLVWKSVKFFGRVGSGIGGEEIYIDKMPHSENYYNLIFRKSAFWQNAHFDWMPTFRQN